MIIKYFDVNKIDIKKNKNILLYGKNEGLIVAEIELESEDEQFDIPEWIGKEVSDDPRYYNMNLMANPYENWKK